ncbi:MAG: YwiC-like family protein [Propionibacteriaceae bacterium]|nr:YwiC-like family protein [Propionibacteriaceae bacterium]
MGPSRNWIPRQHGVWAMMLAPGIAGGFLAGFRWQHAVLIVAWVSAYLAFMAIRGWLRPRHRRQFVVPALTYAGISLVSVIGLLVWRLALLWWAVPLAVLLGASLVLISTGRERTVINDALLIGSSCLMTVVGATCQGLHGMDPSSFLRIVGIPHAWLAAAVLAVYFWGTIFYVKTMIRERGKAGWYATSVVYHLVLVVAAFLLNGWIGAVSVIVAVRAILVPRLWPRAKPAFIGVGEIGISTVLTVALCLTVTL